MQACVHTYAHMTHFHTHIHTHTYMHTHTHTHVHVHALVLSTEWRGEVTVCADGIGEHYCGVVSDGTRG
jgi:hypothetical protein